MLLSNVFELDDNDPILFEIDKSMDMALNGLGYIEPVMLGDSLLLRLFNDTLVTIEYRRAVYSTIENRCPRGKLALGSRKSFH